MDRKAADIRRIDIILSQIVASVSFGVWQDSFWAGMFALCFFIAVTLIIFYDRTKQ